MIRMYGDKSVRSAMRAASQLPEREPINVCDAPSCFCTLIRMPMMMLMIMMMMMIMICHQGLWYEI